MKTLEEIREEYAREVGFENWKELLKKLNLAVYAQHDNDIVTRRFAKEVAMQTQTNCAENAQVLVTPYDEEEWSMKEISSGLLEEYVDGYSIEVHKQSVLNEVNIPEI